MTKFFGSFPDQNSCGVRCLSLIPSYKFSKIEINNNSKGSYEIRIQGRIRV